MKDDMKAEGTVLKDACGRVVANIQIPRLNRETCVGIARRIAACCNVCVGIPARTLEYMAENDNTMHGLVDLAMTLGEECDSLVDVLRDYIAADGRYSDLHEGMDGAEQATIMLDWQTAREKAEKLLERYPNE